MEEKKLAFTVLVEDQNNTDFRANGFPSELVDNEAEEKGSEI